MFQIFTTALYALPGSSCIEVEMHDYSLTGAHRQATIPILPSLTLNLSPHRSWLRIIDRAMSI